MRPHTLALCAFAVSACVSTPRLVPDAPIGQRQEARVTGGGVTLAAVPNAWKTYPESLGDLYTPLFLQIVNEGDYAFDITYGTLTLVDEKGHNYTVVAPTEVARAMRVEVEPPGYQGLGDPTTFDPPNEVGPEVMSDPYMPTYEPTYGYPPSPLYGRQTRRSVSANIIHRALREGRLLPHTQARGFVYFQRAYDASGLSLKLEAPSEYEGSPPLQLETHFTVAR